MSNIVDKLLETARALNEDAYARYQERKLKEGNKKVDEYDKKIALETRKIDMGKKSTADRSKLTTEKDRIQCKHAATIKATDGSGEYHLFPEGDGKVGGYGQYWDEKEVSRHGDEYTLRYKVPTSKEPANAALHDRINKRSEKYTPADKKSTQHESAVKLAELLVEAANILLETENK